MVMSTGLNDMPSQEVAMGSKIELRTSSGAVICLNFSEKDQVLPKIVRLVDPDSDHSVVFRSESGVYHELDSDCTPSLHEFQRLNHCPHCNCDDSVNHSPNGNVRQGNERLEKQREKLQRKLRERKESSKDDGTCDGHCHQVIQLPIQGLRQYVHVNTVKMNGEKCKSSSSEEGNLFECNNFMFSFLFKLRTRRRFIKLSYSGKESTLSFYFCRMILRLSSFKAYMNLNSCPFMLAYP